MLIQIRKDLGVTGKISVCVCVCVGVGRGRKKWSCHQELSDPVQMHLVGGSVFARSEIMPPG